MKLKALFIAVALLFCASAQAQGLGDLLKGLGNGSGIGSTIGNALQGIFTKTDLSLADIVGQYESTGPAVAFKGEGFLKQAGGIAGAAALESKLQPYFQKYGMVGMPVVIDSVGNFTMTIKRIKLMGDVVRNDGDGTFTFNVKIAGKKIGQFTTYIQKSGNDLDLMFDANKLKELISMVGKFTGSKLTSTVSKLLDSYDGACMGFKLSYKGGGISNTGATGTATSADSTSTVKSGVSNLLNILGKSRKK